MLAGIINRATSVRTGLTMSIAETVIIKVKMLDKNCMRV
jgi:hypothetical protein